MHVAALPTGVGERLPDRFLQLRMVVADNEFDARQTPCLELGEEILPTGLAFREHQHRQNLNIGRGFGRRLRLLAAAACMSCDPALQRFSTVRFLDNLGKSMEGVSGVLV